jgi:hypothetical protein
LVEVIKIMEPSQAGSAAFPVLTLDDAVESSSQINGLLPAPLPSAVGGAEVPEEQQENTSQVSIGPIRHSVILDDEISFRRGTHHFATSL